jgi:predicted HTH domain antitoxin
MFVPFEELPDTARIWVYQTDRPLSTEEQARIENQARDFVTQWTAHGQNLKGSAQVRDNFFLVLGVDEKAATPSGCSIDASVRFIRELEQEYKLNFFDRKRITFELGGELRQVPLSSLKELVSTQQVTSNTHFFDPLVQTKSELEQHWPREAGASWLSRFF